MTCDNCGNEAVIYFEIDATDAKGAIVRFGYCEQCQCHCADCEAEAVAIGLPLADAMAKVQSQA